MGSARRAHNLSASSSCPHHRSASHLCIAQHSLSPSQGCSSYPQSVPPQTPWVGSEQSPPEKAGVVLWADVDVRHPQSQGRNPRRCHRSMNSTEEEILTNLEETPVKAELSQKDVIAVEMLGVKAGLG